MSAIENVFCTLDVGAISLSLQELLQLKAHDTLVCKDMRLPFEGVLRVNGSIWAYVSIDQSIETGLSISIKKLAAQSESV